MKKTTTDRITDALMRRGFFRFFLVSGSTGRLLLKCALLLLIPYVHVWFASFLFDAVLKWYFMTWYIFAVMILLLAAAIGLIYLAIRHRSVYR